MQIQQQINDSFTYIYNAYVMLIFVLKELEHFINESNKVLSLTFEWDDSSTLLKILSVLNQINVREPKIKYLFPSLKKIIYMIMQYDVKIPRKCTNQVFIVYLLCHCHK